MFHFIPHNHLPPCPGCHEEWKPLKIWILENLPEENLIHPMVVWKWDGCCLGTAARLQVCVSVLGRVAFCWAWLLLFTCQALVNTIQKERVPLLDSFLWPRGIACRTHLGICSPTKFLLLLFLQNKFWQLKNNSYKTFYRNLTMDIKRLYNFSQDLKPEFG